MRNHISLRQSSLSSFLPNSECNTSPYEGCTFTRRISTFSSSASFNSCTFDTLSVTGNGGAISFSLQSHSLTIEESLFIHCTSSVHGGAIFVDSASDLTVKSSTFIACSATVYGGGIYVYYGCESCSILFCTFTISQAQNGGGLMVSSDFSFSLSSSRAISCDTSYSGGGMYHDSRSTHGSLTVLDSLFTNNRANYTVDKYLNRGGGAFEDYRSTSYQSKYAFSFFNGNNAPDGFGHDICIHTQELSVNNIIHCFTTTQEHSLWNTKYEDYDDWLPLGTLSYLNTRDGDNNPYPDTHPEKSTWFAQITGTGRSDLV